MDNLDRAFERIKRKDFLPFAAKYLARFDRPLPLGQGRMSEKPSDVRRKLEWLDLRPGNKVLHAGSGSGWMSALMVYMVGQAGKVYAIDKTPEMVVFGARNCMNIGIRNARFILTEEYDPGLPNFAPYDRIIASESFEETPTRLFDQLSLGGKMVVPIQDRIHVVLKTQYGKYEEEVFEGVNHLSHT